MNAETKEALIKIVSYCGKHGQRESAFLSPHPQVNVEMYGLLDFIRDMGVTPGEIDGALIAAKAVQ